MARTLSQSYPDLVVKAQQLFWVEGYKSVTPEDLAKHLDVSVSTIRNKYPKDMLFMDALDSYVTTLSDPIMKQIRESNEGLDSLRSFFYMLIDALLDKTFPRSCLMVNTVVELRNEDARVSDVYDRYYGNMRESYKVVLNRSIELGEIKNPERIEQYADFIVGIIFGLSILYKIKPQEELKTYIDEQLSMIA
jgi:TetR/AcrR family transcriptional repressor of nem operon